jgi:uncharacterized DUF497 family protein
MVIVGTITIMEIEFDPEKDKANIIKHGLSLGRIVDCDWSDPVIINDMRFDYGEMRYSAFVPLSERLYNVVFTMRNSTMRIISFRKANHKERERHGRKR